MSTLWVLGSVSVDEVLEVPRLAGAGEVVVAERTRPGHDVGGAGGRHAVAAARAGARVRLLARVGDDPAGAGCVDALADHGVDVTAVTLDPAAPTSRALVTTTPDGARATVVVPGAAAAGADVAVLAGAQPGDVLLASLDVPVASVEQAVALVHDLDVRVVLVAAPYALLPRHVLDRCEPVVTDEPGALALADAGTLPASLLVSFGGRGLSWDGRETQAPAGRWGPGALDVLVGTLAARIACGDTDEDALDAALAAVAAQA